MRPDIGAHRKSEQARRGLREYALELLGEDAPAVAAGQEQKMSSAPIGSNGITGGGETNMRRDEPVRSFGDVKDGDESGCKAAVDLVSRNSQRGRSLASSLLQRCS